MSQEGFALGMALGEFHAEQQKRYTLDEARAELARQECERYGHSVTPMLAMGSSDPVAFVCDRCGKSWVASPV